MENFNKNWLAILLIAIIFGTLGFLVGRTTGHYRGHEKKRMMWKHDGNAMDTFDIRVDVDSNGEVETIVKTDTVMKDGKQIIIKEVKKIRK